MKRILLSFLAFFFFSIALNAQNLFSLQHLENPNLRAQNNTDSIFPPAGLQASVSDDDVSLSWMPSVDGPGEWYGYSDSSLYVTVGFPDGGTWQAATRWDVSQLEGLDGELISKVRFIPGSDVTDYILRIWQGDLADSLIYEQPVNDISIYEWTEILLNEQVQIDSSKELWVGFKIDQAAEQYPLGVDFGPAVAGYGDLASFDVDEWVNGSDFGLDFNWSIQTFISLSNTPEPQFVEIERQQKTREANTFPTAYKVYRDNELLTETPLTDLQYSDNDLESGIYNYGVTALYDSIESDPATIIVQVGGPELLIAPDSLVLVAESGDTLEVEIMLYNTGDDLLEWSIAEMADWLSSDITEGEIVAGDSASLSLTVNTFGLEANVYTSLIEFALNNLNQPVEIFRVDLIVAGYPVILIQPDSLDFGDLILGNSSNLQLLLANAGADALFVNSIVSSAPEFVVANDQYYLTPGEVTFINVEFTPTELTDYSGTITINSNDPNQPITDISISGSGSLAPPLNLQAGLNDEVVELSWLDPSGGPGSWLYYGNGEYSSAVGLTTGGEWFMASRWDEDQLMEFEGEYLTKVRFAYFIGQAEYTLKIWQNDSTPTLLYEQYIGIPDSLVWNEVFLDIPFLIDGQTNLLIGYQVNQEADAFPAGIDNGPAEYGYGDIVSLDGQSWGTLSDLGLDVNWSIQAFVSGDEGLVKMPKTSRKNTETENIYFQLADAQKKLNTPSRSMNDFIGYNIYRNGDLLNSETYLETSYTDTLTEAGTYSYTVSAVYDEGESPLAGPATVTIDSVQLLLPQNWQMIETNIEHHIMLPAEMANHPENGLQSGDYVGVFFAHDQDLILAGMNYWDGDNIQLTAFGDHNLTPMKDGFHSGDQLVWVIFRPGEEKEYLAQAIYDETMPDIDGTFADNGSSGLKALKVEALGIGDETIFNEVKLYPNPVTDRLHLKGIPVNSKLIIQSSRGEIVLEETFSSMNKTIDFEGFPKGLYILQLRNESVNFTRKIVVN